MKVVRSDRHRAHHALELDGGRIIDSWESPVRADVISAALDMATAAAAGPRFVDIEPEPFDRAVAERVHSADYVEFLATAWDRWVDAGYESPAAMGFAWPGRRMSGRRPVDLEGQLGYHSFAADCSIVAGTWEAITTSAALAHTAAGLVSAGDRVAYALCRPPGHHAAIDQFGGYCYLNNAAIAAQRMLDDGAAKVAVLDVDYHHGNGTQDIFYERADVAFVSIHADPSEEFPWFTGYGEETGTGAGLGATRNLPLPRGTETTGWMAALDTALGWIGRRGVDALVVSLGVDTFIDDPISQFRLGAGDFGPIGAAIAGLGTATVFVQEGGYATDALGHNVVSVLTGFDQRGT